MKKISYEQFGPPQEVLQVVETPSRAPGEGEVRVEVLSAPIHNADVMQIAGTYGVKPPLPATPGSEGVGRVVEVGDGVTQLSVGATVVILGGSTWAQEVTGPAASFIALPAGDLDQLAMLVASPATAHLLLTDFVNLKEGDWVIQTAANSAVGSSVVQLAKARGLRTVNIVRREEVVADLEKLGADVVLVGTEDLSSRVEKATDKAPIRLALDAVGGPDLQLLIDSLTKKGTLVSYSQVVEGASPIVPARLLFKQITLVGFWLSQWFKDSSDEERQALFGQLVPLVVGGKLKMEVDSSYSLDQIGEAVGHSMAGRRAGKVMLHPSD